MAASATISGVKRHAKAFAAARPFAPIGVQIQRAIERIAESDCPVLIVGEHGVGKRSIAAQIHAQSHRWRPYRSQASTQPLRRTPQDECGQTPSHQS